MMEKDDAKTSVWWDIENYPVPRDCDARQIAPSIRRALRSLGYFGPLTITAVGKLTDVDPSDLRDLYSTGISFNITPGPVDIVDDMYDWIDTNPPPANMMVISEDEVFMPTLGRMRLSSGYNVLYAYIPECMQDLNFPAECLWQNILADARGSSETRINELPEQCSETGESAWFCQICDRAGVQSFESFMSHLKCKKHSEKMLDYQLYRTKSREEPIF